MHQVLVKEVHLLTEVYQVLVLVSPVLKHNLEDAFILPFLGEGENEGGCCFIQFPSFFVD